MLYLENPEGVFTPWTGEPINDVRYPQNIETLWQADDLAALNLYVPVDPGVPAGGAVASQTVQRVDGVVTIVYDLAAPTADDVWAEMHRRWEGGFDYDFGDDRGVQRIGTTEKDMTDWQKVQALATAATQLGQPDTPIYIVTDTGGVTIKASEWWSIVIATGVFQQPIFQGAAALVAMDPIPADYATNDSYWTAAS